MVFFRHTILGAVLCVFWCFHPFCFFSFDSDEQPIGKLSHSCPPPCFTAFCSDSLPWRQLMTFLQLRVNLAMQGDFPTLTPGEDARAEPCKQLAGGNAAMHQVLLLLHPCYPPECCQISRQLWTPLPPPLRAFCPRSVFLRASVFTARGWMDS